MLQPSFLDPQQSHLPTSRCPPLAVAAIAQGAQYRIQPHINGYNNMYLTAHRVWSRQLNRKGVHAFYYRHPAPLKAPVDIAWVADHEPGELASSLVELPAGGNEVQSYLDLAAPSELSLDEIATALDQLAGAVRREGAAVVHSQSGEIACRFYAHPTSISSPLEEVATLASAVRRVYEDGRKNAPLLIQVEEHELSLHPESIRRLRDLLGPDWQIPPSINIDDDIRADFETLHGPIFQHLIPVLTALDVHQIEAIGGIRFVTQEGSEIDVPRTLRKTVHVVGDLGHRSLLDGSKRSGNMYEILDESATEITTMLGTDLLDQEATGQLHVEWNGFSKKR